MKCLFFVLVTMLIMLNTGCLGQKQLVFEFQDVVKTEKKQISEDQYTEYISIDSILGPIKWSHLKTTKSITSYKIDQVLIDERTQEYGRSISFLDSMPEVAVTPFLIEVTNTKNYPVKDQIIEDFLPDIQFEFCAENCDLSLLVDTKKDVVGFISLEGQEVVHVSEKFKNFLYQKLKQKSLDKNKEP